MTCEIKNEKCPFQIQCSFPTAADDRQPFALYFYPSQGSPERVLVCAYNGHNRCYGDKGLKETYNDFNNVSITVPDTFATRKGFFDCQKGDFSRIKTCSYHPPEICNNNNSTNSTIGLETTTEGINSSLTTEQFGNQGNSTAILVAVIVVLIVIVLIIIIIGCLLLYRKYRSKSLFKKSSIYNGVPSDITSGKREKSSLGKENTGNNVERLLIDRAPDSLMEVIMVLNNPINRYNNEQEANDSQRHPSTSNKTSCASSKLQKTLSSSVSWNGSEDPLLSS